MCARRWYVEPRSNAICGPCSAEHMILSYGYCLFDSWLVCGTTGVPGTQCGLGHIMSGPCLISYVGFIPCA